MVLYFVASQPDPRWTRCTKIYLKYSRFDNLLWVINLNFLILHYWDVKLQTVVRGNNLLSMIWTSQVVWMTVGQWNCRIRNFRDYISQHFATIYKSKEVQSWKFFLKGVGQINAVITLWIHELPNSWLLVVVSLISNAQKIWECPPSHSKMWLFSTDLEKGHSSQRCAFKWK